MVLGSPAGPNLYLQRAERLHPDHRDRILRFAERRLTSGEIQVEPYSPHDLARCLFGDSDGAGEE